MNKREEAAVFELSRLTIALDKLKKSNKVPPEILEHLEAKVQTMRNAIEPALLALFDQAAAKDYDEEEN